MQSEAERDVPPRAPLPPPPSDSLGTQPQHRAASTPNTLAPAAARRQLLAAGAACACLGAARARARRRVGYTPGCARGERASARQRCGAAGPRDRRPALHGLRT